MADLLARAATERGEVDYFEDLSKFQLNNIFKGKIMSEWNNRWTNNSKGRLIFEIFPKVSLKRTRSNFFLNQIISGHGAIPTFQHQRFGRMDICQCGDLGTIDHIIKVCPLLKDIRLGYEYLLRNRTRRELILDFYSSKLLSRLMDVYFKLYMNSMVVCVYPCI